MKHFGSVIKFLAVGFIILIILFAVFPTAKNGALKKAQADSMNAYPNTCLGGWQNPGNAAGVPDVSPGGTSFTNDNSAVLDQAQAQIFCGSFQATDQSQVPVSVTLHFSWNVIFASQASSSGDIDTNADTGNSSWDSVLNSTSTGTSTPDISTDTTTDQSGDASTNIETSTSVSVPTPPPPTPTTTPDQSSTSFLKNIFDNPFAFFAEKAFADSTDTADTTDATDVTIDTSTTNAATTTNVSVDTSGDFMDVSYSLDGTTWIDLGQVNASDWQNYSVTIPVSSWSDINNLQIQLNPDISPDEPTVYVDGMWLEVDYNQSILNDLQDVASATIGAVTDLSNTVDNALTDLLSPATSTPPQDTTNTNTSSTPTPPSSPQHRYAFILQGTQSIKVGTLEWGPSGVASSAAATPVGSNAPQPTVSLPAPNTIQIAGSCNSAYYTILIFPHPDDYRTNPALAIYNEARPCVGGSFSLTIADMDLPSQLPIGTYYLMVADQGKTGPWAPYPELYPIELGNASSS